MGYKRPTIKERLEQLTGHKLMGYTTTQDELDRLFHEKMIQQLQQYKNPAATNTAAQSIANQQVQWAGGSLSGNGYYYTGTGAMMGTVTTGTSVHNISTVDGLTAPKRLLDADELLGQINNLLFGIKALKADATL